MENTAIIDIIPIKEQTQTEQSDPQEQMSKDVKELKVLSRVPRAR